MLAAVCLVWCEPQLPLSTLDNDGKDELIPCDNAEHWQLRRNLLISLSRPFPSVTVLDVNYCILELHKPNKLLSFMFFTELTAFSCDA